MKKLIFLLCCAGIFSINTAAQDNFEKSVIAFYNVENLFDTINDPVTRDDDFTPGGTKQWTSERYFKKLNDLAHILSSIDKEKLPGLIGFAEIENKKVLEDLVKTEYLKNGQYRIVHEESPDVRGIDVGLIYSTNQFKYLNHRSIPVPLETEYKVRDILYVKGLLDKDTLHLFVNHWKSRSGGQEETEPQRVSCALTLRNVIDSVILINPEANILVMGDLNDTPTDKSVKEALKADNKNDTKSLYDLMLPLAEKGLGTHSYRGEWNVLDHIIVSGSLLNGTSGLSVKNKEGYIFSEDWITYESKDGNKSPNRTYGGPNYYGGYSDHYPVYVILTKQH